MSKRGGRFVAFKGATRLAEGDWAGVSQAAWCALDMGGDQAVLVFDCGTGSTVDLDPRERGGETEAAEPAKRGRPRLGVVAREVTLLPRHWAWLASQPGGASVALRKLVEGARKSGGEADDRRAARDAAWGFMQTMAGDLPGFEEASRALFADDMTTLAERMAAWPTDVRDQVLALLNQTASREGGAR